MDNRVDDRVSIREEVVTIPTYGVGQPDKNPMFLEKRVYQGSSGAVYPYPIVESISDVKADKDYQAIILENRYLKVMLLPEIGGRVQMALDKTNGYHFVYYNRVIKPALVGLTGPWISGGIEFNWPQHHRPSTFEPVDYTLEEHPDGSKTAWLGEIERLTRTKGMAGFTLYPGRAYLEIRVQLYNRTSEPQTFLWWANPAVRVGGEVQSVFPPDVHAVMDHGKRDVSTFPIATGTYYKVDYSPGTDISRYKNIPVPTSYMAYHSDFDFLGSYDHRAEAGMLHVANHHLVPGKKQWTWGNGDFGQAWDRQLTDEDGPYVELMCGAFTDNQPDFTWLHPGEEKRFTQVFMPYKLIGPPKNAAKDAAVSLEVDGGRVRLGVYLSSPRTVRVMLQAGEAALYDQTAALSPETALVETLTLDRDRRPQELTLRVVDVAGGAELVSYTPLPEEQPDIPPPAQAARPPAEIETNEELYLNGLHLEQYRHATYEPEAYYREALRRDPGDSRCNNALGLLLLRRGRFEEAEGFFRTAVERLTARNPNPYDGEPFYHLGRSLAMQSRDGEAFDAFYKAAWSAAWASAAYFELAELASRARRFEEALALVEESLAANRRHHRAGHLRAALLRQLGRKDEARAAVEEGLALDGMNYGLCYERYLLDGDEGYRRLFRDNPHTYIEIALDYLHAGLFEEALDLLGEAPGDPMAAYYRGWAAFQAGDEERALAYFEEAAGLPSDYCFPNRAEAVLALGAALRLNPGDRRAPYYLGNFWYAHRQYDLAVEMWERARLADPGFATPYRNLGLAAMNKQSDPDRALRLYERAFALDRSDARVLFELDQLYKKTGKAPGERLQFLDAHLDLVDRRDDLAVERVSLLNHVGRHEDALAVLLGRTFHPWEGGEGKVTGQYVLSLVEIAKERLGEGRFAEAVDCLERARVYPDNLGEGRLAAAPENQIDYFLGRAYEGLGDGERARACFERASLGSLEPVSPLYYNDQPPEMIFYQGLALGGLGRESEAEAIFERLVGYGREHLDDRVTVDYFAVSLPDFLVFDDDLERRSRVHCHFMMALGYLGLGQNGEAAYHFERVLALAPHHLGAVVHRGMDELAAA
jgi:tetratricopeptide (TPR) repeat protein